LHYRRCGLRVDIRVADRAAHVETGDDAPHDALDAMVVESWEVLAREDEMARDSMFPEQRAAHDRIYGVRKSALGDTGRWLCP
jgi:hypothetical protein